MKICNQIIILLIFSIIFSNDNPLDQTLGRDKDPKIAEDLSKVQLFMRKAKWGTINLFGSRFIARLVFPKGTISYFDIDDKVVAFTVDDGFCGVDNIQGDMTEDVRKLFKKYDARATFFTSGSHCSNTSKSHIMNLLEDGHELANHGMYDWPYNKYTKEQFLNDFNQTTENLKIYIDDIPKYYRAPHAKISSEMIEVLDEKGYKHIMCDAYAADTEVPDPVWISNMILKNIKPGSIVLIHMPEKGVREWNYEAMELTLKGLKDLGYKIETFSYLYELSQL